eukprot:gene22704-29861_t
MSSLVSDIKLDNNADYESDIDLDELIYGNNLEPEPTYTMQNRSPKTAPPLRRQRTFHSVSTPALAATRNGPNLPVLTNVTSREATPSSPAYSNYRASTAPDENFAPLSPMRIGPASRMGPQSSAQWPPKKTASTSFMSPNTPKRPTSIIQWKPGTAEIIRFKSEATGELDPFASASGDFGFTPTRGLGTAGAGASGSASVGASVHASAGPGVRNIRTAPATQGDLGTPLSPTRMKRAVGGERGFGIMLDKQGEVLHPPTDQITNKLLSLPDLVCKSASGDIFLVELSDVQSKLHKRRLGKQGLKVWHEFEEQTSSNPWSQSAWREKDPYRDMVSSKVGKSATAPTEIGRSRSLRRPTEDHPAGSKSIRTEDHELEEHLYRGS